MDSKTLRRKFINYFNQHGHTVLTSSSLIPKNDSSLLFTNSGMVPFKNFFLSKNSPPYLRVVTSQRCIRVNGKHNDFNNVGYTSCHHTFFEMLGNFSFGDYFKFDAIFFSWNFLIKELGLSKKKETAHIVLKSRVFKSVPYAFFSYRTCH